ncbi:MAG: hypothetical protein GY862_29900 [Gammaproteobacteria bacterium]|nr:hypothetical protein [Gammaproteobacteria bacterium]
MLLLYAATLFLSATLLFGVQPMFTKMVLPLLGGSSTVWNTAMVFFQGTLLCGYAYAHLSSRWLGLKRQTILHGAVLLATLFVLPFSVASGWTPPLEDNPVLWLIGLFAVSVGLPFFAVSATAPLLQKWFAHTGHPAAANPYFLYASSNAGSILALLAYPVILEPLLNTTDQRQVWAGGYAALTVLMLACIAVLWRKFRTIAADSPSKEAEAERITWKRRLHWIALAFVPSSLLLGVTLYITTDLVAVPLLWVIPLSLYLFSFVIVFSRRPLLKHRWMLMLQPIVILPLAVTFGLSPTKLIVFAPLHLLAFFISAMVCHGELVKRRPATEHLTEFYFWMSLGGVLGGAFNTLLAPLIFESVLEYPLAMVLAYMLRPSSSPGGKYSRYLDVALPIVLLLIVVIPIRAVSAGAEQYSGIAIVIWAMFVGLFVYVLKERPLRFGLGIAMLFFGPGIAEYSNERLLAQERTFFGVHKVLTDRTGRFHELYHGTTMHGAQHVHPALRKEPLTYFHRGSPIGQVFSLLANTDRVKKVALVGLGAGAITCYRQPGQEWTIYEIDPAVVRLARDPNYFSYLSDCAGGANIVLGDARLSLRNAPKGYFDLIILDAYSSDVLPVHLITREALAMYTDKLADHGLLLGNASNRYINLIQVFSAQAADAGLVGRSQHPRDHTLQEHAAYRYAADWVVMARNRSDLAMLEGDPRWLPLVPQPGQNAWTDDFSNIFRVIRW